MRVALVSGFWGQNIGNAFFNIGGKWILEQIFGSGNVEFIQDQPAYRTFNRKHKGNPKNDFNLLRYLETDYIVLQGPMMTTSFRAIWEDAFKQYKKRGTKIILLGAAFFKYTEQEIEAIIKFLKEYPPIIISTRDHYTYEAIKDCAQFTYSGIDSAFFVTEVYRAFKLTCEPYIIINFDRWPEPNIKLSSDKFSSDSKNNCCFEALGYHWKLNSPGLQYRLSNKGKWQAYIGALLDRRKLPPQIADFTIVRTEHRVNPHITWKVYKQPNMVASDEPFTYFTVYANTKLTLSDRVHACVATLAYGNPAMLFTPSPRTRLFERLGLNDIKKRPIRLDPERLKLEKDKQLSFLKESIECWR